MSNPYSHGSSGLPDGNSSSSGADRFPPRMYPDPPPAPITYSTQRGSIISQLLNAPDETSTHTSAYAHGHSRNDSLRNSASYQGRSWTNTTHLPPLSKAFDSYMRSSGLMDTSDQQSSTAFITPSYLKGSAYVQKLEDAHKTRLARQKDGQNTQGQTGNSLNRSPSSTSLHAKVPVHRGLSHYVLERPPLDDDELFPSLPTKLNKDDKNANLEVLGNGFEVRFAGSKGTTERENEAYSIRADHHMPPQCGIYYFEVTILGTKRDSATIGIGFSSRSVALSRPPGWEPESYGYHGDDGRTYQAHNGGKEYGPHFTMNDVIGCGINFREKTAFYTRNGVLLGNAFADVKGRMYPSVGLKRAGEHVRVNFGQDPFVFDIDSVMKREKERFHAEIASTSLSALSPLKERDLVQTLVLQFLQQDGYIETARAFAEEMHTEKKSLSIDPNEVIEDINVRDDEHATKRQRIRRAVLEGDIDRALKHTNAFYPEVLEHYEHVHFRLRCRKFIEMIRTAAEMRTSAEGKKSNGHVPLQPHVQTMDLDQNGSTFDQMDTEDGFDVNSAMSLDELELQTLMYGQSLQAEYREDPRREITESLESIYALLAYTNPLKEKDVAHLLDKKGRVVVAEELNSAILMSLGKSSRSALEEVYAQTSVLLEDLGETGGSGAFVSLHDVIDDIPRPRSY
ncbi:ran-binding protein [Plectosphaerella plurivora]|uniref:Ran-binding protein n=1 Tax=Plectosphaerella plurivora TaxID=936078 RepID=A0A9P8VG66_9PEZI|nr:ran-binding protein [Plectosphaerella plurivora]